VTPTHVLERTAVRAAAETLLDEYARTEDRGGCDAGPAVLATLVTGGERPPGDAPPARAMAAWLRDFRTPSRHPGLYGAGAAGRMFALRIAAATWPRLHDPLKAQRARLVEYAAAPRWRTSQLGWEDYDLIWGPSGVLLAFALDPDATWAERAPLTAALARLCHGEDLPLLRVDQYHGEKLRGWNVGRVNLGLAHGLPGVMTALRAAAEADGLDDGLRELLRRLGTRLVAESYTDDRGVITWPFGTTRPDGHRAPKGTGRRQAWCYGCPGNAWTLWEVARVLGDAELGAFAAESARSFVSAYDDELYLDGLGLCHGAAGLMLLFDAFAGYMGLAGAENLADHLAAHLMSRLDELAATGWSLQEGASGALSALLTMTGGDRRWLGALGLR
jgi:lantibiotic biosynthesis protein